MPKNLLDDNRFAALCKAKHGYMLVNKHDAYVGRSVLHYGEWGEHEVDLFMELIGPGDVVVEVGSNIGSHLLPLANRVGKTGRVYGFEPQRIVYQNLCANVALNSLTNVECFHEAVSDRAGTAYIPEMNFDTETNFGGVRVSTNTADAPVPQVMLDEKLGYLQRLNFLKVDAEDMELPVIQGAAKLIVQHRPYLYLENNPGNTNQAALVSAVQRIDYDVYWHVTLLYNPDNFFKNAENVFGEFGSYNIFCCPKEKPFPHVERFGLKLISDPAQMPY